MGYQQQPNFGQRQTRIRGQLRQERIRADAAQREMLKEAREQDGSQPPSALRRLLDRFRSGS